MRAYGFILGLIFSLFMYLRFTNAPFSKTSVVFLLVIACSIEIFLNRKINKIKKSTLIFSKAFIAYIVSVSFCFLLLGTPIFEEKLMIILIFSLMPSILVSSIGWTDRSKTTDDPVDTDGWHWYRKFLGTYRERNSLGNSLVVIYQIPIILCAKLTVIRFGAFFDVLPN